MKFGVLNAPSTFNSHPDSAVSQPRKGSGLSLDLGDEILEMRSRWREVVERVVLLSSSGTRATRCLRYMDDPRWGFSWRR
jgi:hypothetical protein